MRRITEQHENRLRGQGEKTLLRVLLQHMQADASFRFEIGQMMERAPLRPDERKAVGWLMGTLAGSPLPDASDADAGATEPERCVA